MANKNFKVRVGLEAPLIAADDGTTAITISNSTGNIALAGSLDVQGGTITESTGALSITTGASNGSITLDPNGTGNVVLTFANGGNLTNDRNYVFGAIRNATTQTTNGDIWELNTSAAQSATNPYYRGISLSNSGDTTRGPATLMRSFPIGGSGSGVAQRGRLIFEKARGFPDGVSTGPTAVQNADIIGSIDATGYSSTGWINDTLGIVPLFFGFSAAENWVSNTNLGTAFSLNQAPTATTITTAANLVQTLLINPQLSASRSDAFTWANGKAGTTQTMALDISGNLTVTGDVRVNGGDIQNPGGTSAITLTSANTATTVRGDAITLEDNAGTDFAVLSANTAKFNVPVTTELTTTTISEGTTYTPAATVDNNISVQINTLSGGTTVIDLINLTGNSRGASYNILVFNNTASGTPIQVKNTRINSNNLMTHTITAGDRIIVNAYVVGDYATATHLVVA